MNPAATSTTSTALSTAPAIAGARIAHLFRASLKQGRLHPLYVPMLQYRSAQTAVPA